MDYRLPLIFMLFCVNSVFADFSSTKMFHHPLYIEQGEPFILDFRGEWPTDCHPGEQKPVIREYTGDSVLIEFEIIVEHVTCNITPTPYRVLVDMSDVVDDVVGDPRVLEVTVRFGESELNKILDKQCTMCDPPPPPRDIKPEPGVYQGEGLQKQGILLARQNDRMGVYPLVYDELGNNQWLFGGGGVIEDVYFVKLKELSDGQCLGCPPPDDPPQKEVVGKLTMLMDSEGVIQVKVNDGLFTEYRMVEFGYGEFVYGGGTTAELRFPNITGRWAIAELGNASPQETPAEPIIPLVFDVAYEFDTIRPCMPICYMPDLLSLTFSVNSIDEDEVAQMECWNVPDSENKLELTCDVSSPDINDGAFLYEVRELSLERLKFKYVGPVISGLSDGDFVAVRID